MTKSDGKYPNKIDFEPKVPGVVNSDELPLADPSDSQTSDVFLRNAQEKAGEYIQSAFGANKLGARKASVRNSIGERKAYNRQFNQLLHDKWNEVKPHKDPFKPNIKWTATSSYSQ